MFRPTKPVFAISQVPCGRVMNPWQFIAHWTLKLSTGVLVQLTSIVKVLTVEGHAGQLPTGVAVGAAVGTLVGVLVGTIVGAEVGAFVGAEVGAFVGAEVGAFVGADVGAFVGAEVGAFVGAEVGAFVGAD